MEKQPQNTADTALLVIDAQLQYCRRGAFTIPQIEKALDRIDSLRASFNELGLPVFLVYNTPYTTTPYAAPTGYDSFYRQGDDLSGYEIVAKHGNSAFRYTRKEQGPGFLTTDTWLNRKLKASYPQLRRFITCGFNTSACVADTLLDGAEQGFSMIVASDACANGNYEDDHMHDMTLMAMANEGIMVSRTYEIELWLQSGMQGTPDITVPKNQRVFVNRNRGQARSPV